MKANHSFESTDSSVLQHMGRTADKKKKIAVIFGGCSPEYSISLQSAYAVISNMDKNRYESVLVGISEGGDWFLFRGDTAKIESDTWCNPDDCTPVTLSLDRSEGSFLVFGKDGVSRLPIDAAFPVLHGKYGEDGTIQGVFIMAGIPLVGCGVLSSALCMDKDRAHTLAHAAGVSVPASYVLSRNTPEGEITQKAEKLGYPLFIKPVKAGSSYGVTRVADQSGVMPAVALAFQYDEEILLEEGISGFEVGCAVMGNETLTIGEVDEIELAEGFFNFTEKYTLETSAIYVPARIGSEKAAEIKKTAGIIYRALNCQGFARIDMFLTPTGEIVFNEVNTIPGFTAHSRFPSMMRACGISFEQVITAVIESAAVL